MTFISTIFYLPTVFLVWIGSLIWVALTYTFIPILLWYFYITFSKK